MFSGRHFDRSVILLCVRWYLTYNFSLRDLEEMMAERGIQLTIPQSIDGLSGSHRCCSNVQPSQATCRP